MDRLVANYDVPERVSLDVSGVDRLRFEIVKDGTTVGIFDPTLWRAGQTPRETGKVTLATGKPTMLVRDLRPYLQKAYKEFREGHKSLQGAPRQNSGRKRSREQADRVDDTIWTDGRRSRIR